VCGVGGWGGGGGVGGGGGGGGGGMNPPNLAPLGTPLLSNGELHNIYALLLYSHTSLAVRSLPSTSTVIATFFMQHVIASVTDKI